jgi:hypothetical protein
VVLAVLPALVGFGLSGAAAGPFAPVAVVAAIAGGANAWGLVPSRAESQAAAISIDEAGFFPDLGTQAGRRRR